MIAAAIVIVLISVIALNLLHAHNHASAPVQASSIFTTEKQTGIVSQRFFHNRFYLKRMLSHSLDQVSFLMAHGSIASATPRAHFAQRSSRSTCAASTYSRNRLA